MAAIHESGEFILRMRREIVQVSRHYLGTNVGKFILLACEE
jgi:hypothetical protein